MKQPKHKVKQIHHEEKSAHLNNRYDDHTINKGKQTSKHPTKRKRAEIKNSTIGGF